MRKGNYRFLFVFVVCAIIANGSYWHPASNNEAKKDHVPKVVPSWSGIKIL